MLCASNGSAADHKKADVSSPTPEIQDTHQEATSTIQHMKEKESQNSTDKNSLQSPQADVTEIPSPSDITNIVTVKPLRKSRRSSVQNARRSLNKSIGDVDLKYTADQGSSSSWIVTSVEISNDKPEKISPHGQKCVDDSNLTHNNKSKENTKSTQQSKKSTDNQTFLEDSTLSQTSELSTVSTLSSSMSVMYDGMGPSFLNETKSRPSIFEFKPQKPKKKKPKKTYQPHVKSSEDEDSGRSDGPSSDGSSRPEEKKKNNRKLSKADSSSSSILSRHNRPSLVMTSLHSSEQEIVFSIVKTLGGFVITDNVLESTTHVIVGEPRRTLNVISAISQGCWVLTQDWVMQSLDAGSWLPEEGFECVDHFPAARTARLERLTAPEPFKQSIFSSVGPIFISQKIVPPREKLTNLVKACGGQITTSLDNAQIYVGTDYYPDIHCLKSIWILDCITSHSQLGFTNYLLGRPKQAESPEF